MGGRRTSLRNQVRRIHLWLGLMLGGLFALLGVTGSALVFYPEIDRLFHPELQIAGPSPDWDRALATVRASWPEKQGSWRFEVTEKGGAIPARYYNPPEREGHAFRPMMVWLSSDGGQVLRQDYWGEYAVTFIYDLHYRLLLGEVGGMVLGWTGFGLLALLLSGLWAWWPRGTLAKALRFKRRSPPSRRLRDWHKLSGLVGIILLLLLTGTGVMLELPEESDAVLGAVGLPIAPMDHVYAAPVVAPQISPTEAIAAARKALSGARIAWVETPPAAGGMYRLRMQVPGDPSFRFPHSFVWVDGANGRVRMVDDLRKAAPGNKVNAWIHPLHDGSAFGLAGRILTALAGLLPLVLFITGWRRWRLRRRRN